MIFEDICIAESATVQEALKQLDKTALRTLFVVAADRTFLGTLTDGDIRRYILAGRAISEDISRVYNKSPRIASSLDNARKLYDPRHYHVIPIVNPEGKIVDAYIGAESGVYREHANLSLPVVINAGGKGTRLDPYTKVLPKPLIPVGDYPIIEHIFREYQQYDCNDFSVIVNYKKDIMKAYFKDKDSQLYDISWVDEEEPLGTGGGLSLLKGKLSSTFFFTNCDILLKANYESMVKFHKENSNLVTMICAYKTMSLPYGVVEMGKNGAILEMKEKPEFSFLTNTGMYILEPEVIDYIGDNERIGFPDVVERIKSDGGKVAAYPVRENEWYDMGQLPELERMREMILAGE